MSTYEAKLNDRGEYFNHGELQAGVLLIYFPKKDRVKIKPRAISKDSSEVNFLELERLAKAQGA